jgi:hypothetical protein
MSKITIGIVGAFVAAGTVATVIELRANRGLRAELGALHAASDEARRLRPEGQSSGAVSQTSGTNNPDMTELERLRARAAQLKARPEGVTDAQMKLAASCRNVGRATPAEALETLTWAATVGDTDALMQGYIFSAETKDQLDAFYASLSDAVRARYGTPERLLGARWLAMAKTQLPVASQLLDQKSDPAGALDTIVVHAWTRLPSGQEKLDGIKLQHTANGWGVPVPKSPDAAWAKLATLFDPITGEFRGAGN